MTKFLDFDTAETFPAFQPENVAVGLIRCGARPVLQRVSLRKKFGGSTIAKSGKFSSRPLSSICSSKISDKNNDN